jgi:flagellar hook protein FlgE
MFTSFSTALSALRAHTTAIDVVGHNLANLNTPGFKTSAVAFRDLVTQSVGAGLGDTQVGFGVGQPTTLRQFTQGAIEDSSGALSVAIQGDGFLVARTSSDAIVYTRGGYLQVDSEGRLLTSTGETLQGWTESGGVLDTNGPIGDIVVPVGTLKQPVPTTQFSLDLNLDATASAGDDFSTVIEVFDSLGGSHIVTVDFTKSAANEWEYSISVPDEDVTTPIAPVTGTLTFDDGGTLTSPTEAGPFPEISITGLANGAADMTLSWEMYEGSEPRITQYAQASAVSANAQDGAASSQLSQVGIADGGIVLAQFSDGEQMVVGQLAMASIRNPESLIAVGNNCYQLSQRSALPAVGLPGTGGRGTIIGGSVENSTSDIAKEFTNLIVLQRGYQANSRVITTVDEISQETINLKR